MKYTILIFVSIIVLFTHCGTYKGTIKIDVPKQSQIVNEVAVKKIVTAYSTKPSILVRLFSQQGVAESKNDITIASAIESGLSSIFEIKDRTVFNQDLLQGNLSLAVAIDRINPDYFLEITMVELTQDINTFYIKGHPNRAKLIKRHPFAVQRMEAKLFDRDNVMIANFLFYYIPCPSKDKGCSYILKKRNHSWYLADDDGNIIMSSKYQNKAITSRNKDIYDYATHIMAPTIANTLNKYF